MHLGGIEEGALPARRVLGQQAARIQRQHRAEGKCGGRQVDRAATGGRG
jgi:hypothetical protein